MVARVATFEGVDAAVARGKFGEAMAVVQPLLDSRAGHEFSVDLLAENGKAMTISFFDSTENAEAAEPTFDEEMPRALGDFFGDWAGRRVSVDRYEVVGDTRG